MSRAPDERFTSLLEMQAFKRRVCDNKPLPCRQQP
jgi:hypothetical protein